ncbi:hypothetical protein Poli38472_014339 [Pythium oligandrum]|uniref:Protein kinase domain-containing protein n=1 Tax=Pythium oligandrum TaxID=41045 RepID=A0A8K1FCY1_PYTOL|nr:hypothetical protein Poli38472_014339 [Pythium oligandrum]|eukprot:TMW57736.1 hypothetical protein Poli38472_014339 [Pythium oligandrum]
MRPRFNAGGLALSIGRLCVRFGVALVLLQTLSMHVQVTCAATSTKKPTYTMYNCSDIVTVSGVCTNSSDPNNAYRFVCIGVEPDSCPSKPTVAKLDSNTLDISNQGVEQIVGMEDLSNLLKNLYMQDNRISNLTLSYGDQRGGNLQVLQAANNRLESFASIVVPMALTKVNVSGNPMPEIYVPEVYSNLQELIALETTLTALNLKDAGGLLTVDASYNSLSSVNDMNFTNQLRYITVAHNKLTDWRDFKPPIALRHLDASWNNANHFIRGDWSTYDKLETLDFSYNLITEITGTIFPAYPLQIDLRGNPLQLIEIRSSDLQTFQTSAIFIDEVAPLAADCKSDKATKESIGNFSVCVYDDDDFEALMAGSSDGSSNAPSSSSSSSSGSRNQPGDGVSGSSNIGLYVGVAVGVVVLIAIIAFIFFRRRRSAMHADDTPYSDVTKLTITGGSTGSSTNSHIIEALQDPRFVSLRVDPDDVTVLQELGQGKYTTISVVRVGEHEMMMKRIQRKLVLEDPNIAMQFIAEIQLHSTLEHPKVVQFLGVSGTSMVDLTMYCELMPNGSLATLLLGLKDSRNSLGWVRSVDSDNEENEHWLPSKLDLAIDVVEALVYLHSYDPPVVHGDLCPRNVLLTADWTAKLTSFREHQDVGAVVAGRLGSISSLAPELLTGHGERSPASDVYAFGMLLAELDTCEPPFRSLTNARTNAQLAAEITERGARPALRPNCPVEIQAIVWSCLEANPSQRPTCVKLHYDLSQLRRAMQMSP